jgi:hypothetical protein
MTTVPENTDFTGYSPALGDWRLSIALWITGADGKVFDKPMQANVTTSFDSGKIKASFPTPSAAALHLNISWRAAKRAHELRNQLLADDLKPAYETHLLQFQNANCGPLFDLFEELITCVSGAFSAVEAFCNRIIIDHAKEDLIVKRNKVKENLSPEDVVRWVSIEQKVKRIVPDLCGVPTPAGKAVYGQFLRIKELRDSITHFKRHDEARLMGQLHEPTALFKLFLSDQYAIPENALALIEHFGSTTIQSPRWTKNPEWVRPTEVNAKGLGAWEAKAQGVRANHGISKSR